MTLCSVNYHSMQPHGKWKCKPTHSYRGQHIQISDHFHATDPGTHGLVPKLVLMPWRAEIYLALSRIELQFVCRAVHSLVTVMTEDKCTQESLTCRRNVGLLCNEKEAIIARAPLTVRSYITSYKMYRHVLTFGPAEMHVIHNCWRWRTYLYAHMHVIYRAVWDHQCKIFG